MGRIIEKPGEKVRGDVEKGGEDGDEREIGEAGADVTTGKKCEAEKGEEGAGIARRGFMPMETGDNVEGESNGVEAGDEEKEWGEREKEIENDKDAGGAGESGEVTAVVRWGETEEMEDLGGEENNEAEFRSIIEGKDDVGNASREHGGEEEIVFREDFGDINETEGDTADAEEGEKIAVRRE